MKTVKDNLIESWGKLNKAAINNRKYKGMRYTTSDMDGTYIICSEILEGKKMHVLSGSAEANFLESVKSINKKKVPMGCWYWI